jgi:hypothetical protein
LEHVLEQLSCGSQRVRLIASCQQPFEVSLESGGLAQYQVLSASVELCLDILSVVSVELSEEEHLEEASGALIGIECHTENGLWTLGLAEVEAEG